MNMTSDDLLKMIGKQQMVIEVLQAQLSAKEEKSAKFDTTRGEPATYPLEEEAATAKGYET